jgi:large subunit ribosomal protein L47
VCVKERNRIATSTYERHRLAAGYGDYESERREKTVSALTTGLVACLPSWWNLISLADMTAIENA